MGDRKQFLLYMDRELHKALRVLAAQRGRNMSEIVRDLIKKEVGDEERV
jgi:plasmid stability protein